MADVGIEAVGFLAATLTTASFLPQVAKTWRTGSADDFSMLWIALFGAGLSCWLGYGLLIGSPAIVIANGLTLALVLSIGWIKTTSAK
ncbi:MAG: hypothetical protein GC199_11230 [Alphaproteobacteria bacterium]|nr:hypothetical protein [Alphaproteobacteria bacterium]